MAYATCLDLTTCSLSQTAEKLEELELAERHMREGMRQFENAAEDCSNVAETYLEPLRSDWLLLRFSF